MSSHKERAHALLAPSASSRWVRCTGSVLLSEQLLKIIPPESSAFAEEGTLAHEVAEAEVNAMMQGDSAVHDKEIDSEMLAHAQAYAQFIADEALLSDAVLVEEKLDMTTVIPECWGTVDCLIMSRDGVLNVIDYKYGVGVKVEAKENFQLICYAIGAFLKYNETYNFKKIRLTIYQPRIDNIDSWELSPTALQCFIDLFSKKGKEACQSKEHFEAGEHCKFCPASSICPIKLKTVETAIMQSTSLKDQIDADMLGDFLNIVEVLEKWSKAVKETALRAAKNGILPRDRKLVEGRKTRTWFDESAVEREFENIGDELYSRKLISPAQLEKIVGKDQVKDFVEVKAGNLTLVHVSDVRQPAKTEAELVFTKI